MAARSALIVIVGGLLLLACGGGSQDPDLSPSVWAVLPDSGFVTGGAVLRMQGAGFATAGAGQPRVRVGDVEASEVVVLGGDMLEFVLPANPAGAAHVDVVTNHGVDRLVSGFTYFGYPPTVEPPGVRIETTRPGASDALRPQICCHGETLYVVWMDMRNGAGDIYFQRSTDAGFSWLAEDVRLDTDAAGTGESADPTLCCDGDRVVVVWEDARNGSLDIYANRSLDGGRTWLGQDRRVDTDPPGAAQSEWPSVCCEGEHVFVAWGDHRLGDHRIFCNRSIDGGATWSSPDLRIDHNDVIAAPSWVPSVGRDGETVYVAWYDLRNGAFDIWFNRSADDGRTWLPADVRLDTDDPGAAHSTLGNLCCEGERVVVTWQDQRHVGAVMGSRDVYLNRSLDGGRTWLSADLRVNTDDAASAYRAIPSVSCSGDHVYVVWSDARNGQHDIYARASQDAGVTWQASDRRLDTDPPGDEFSTGPLIACDGPSAYAAWFDGRIDGGGVFLNATADGGLTWLANDIHVSGTLGVAGGQGTWLACTGARAHLVYLGTPDETAWDVWFNTTFP